MRIRSHIQRRGTAATTRPERAIEFAPAGRPAEAPRFAVAAVVEHGGAGSKTAAPLVRDIMRELFLRFAPEKVPYAMERYRKETARLYGVLDHQLSRHAFLAEEYSVADIATYPWVARHEWQEVDLADYPSVRRWFEEISARPAVRRGMAVPT